MRRRTLFATASLLVGGCRENSPDSSLNNTSKFVITRIEEISAEARSRRSRFESAMRANDLLGFDSREVTADLSSTQSILDALKTTPDSENQIILCGSEFMLQSALSAYSQANLLVASHNNPRLKFSSSQMQNVTGFHFGRTSIGYPVGLLNRAGVFPEKVIIVGDQSFANYWEKIKGRFVDDVPSVRFSNEVVTSQAKLNTFVTSSMYKASDSIILFDTDFSEQNSNLLVSTLNQKKPVAIFPYFTFVEQGAALAYWPSIPDPFGIWARQIKLILAGVKPRQIPIEEPVVFNTAINIASAKRIGLKVSPSFLKSADKVYES
jgi:ABC transporter substrate binding protein